MNPIRITTATIAAVATAALMSAEFAAPANAETYEQCMARKRAEGSVTSYSDEVCKWADVGHDKTPAPAPATTYAPPTTGSSDGITGFIEAAFPWVVGIIVVVGIIALIANIAGESATEKKQAEEATLSRGRAIADAWHADELAAGREPERPQTTDADLRRYAAFSAMVAWTPGTAFASVVGRDGDVSAASQAWFDAAKAARFGDFDTETGKFTPAATLAHVEQQGREDVVLIVEPRDVFVTEQQLDKVLNFLVKTAHVRCASPFTRDHATGRYRTVLTNTEAQSAPVDPPQETVVPDPAAGWEW